MNMLYIKLLQKNYIEEIIENLFEYGDYNCYLLYMNRPYLYLLV